MAIKWSQAWVEERKADFQSMRGKIATYDLIALRSFLEQHGVTGEALKLNPSRTMKCAKELINRLEAEFDQEITQRKEQAAERRAEAARSRLQVVEKIIHLPAGTLPKVEEQESQEPQQQPIVLFATEDEVVTLRQRLDKVEGELGQLKAWQEKPLLVQAGAGEGTPFADWTKSVDAAMGEMAQIKERLAKFEQKFETYRQQGDETVQNLKGLRERVADLEGVRAEAVTKKGMSSFLNTMEAFAMVADQVQSTYPTPDELVERMKAVLKVLGYENAPWATFAVSWDFWFKKDGLQVCRLKEQMKTLRAAMAIVEMPKRVEPAVLIVDEPKAGGGEVVSNGSRKDSDDLDIPAFLRR